MILGVVIMRVLDDAFAHFEGQIQAAKRGVAEFEVFDNPERVKIVVEGKALGAHGGVEGFFAGVAERWMADVVHEGQRFHQVGVESKLRGNRARDLRDFNRMGEAVAEVVGVAARENLSFRFQPAEGAGMNDAVPVALKVIAVGMSGLGMAASAGVFDADGEVGEHGVSSRQSVASSQSKPTLAARCETRNLTFRSRSQRLSSERIGGYASARLIAGTLTTGYRLLLLGFLSRQFHFCGVEFF